MRVLWQVAQALAGVVVAILTFAGRLDRAAKLLGMEDHHALVSGSLVVVATAFVLVKVLRLIALLTVRPELRYINVASSPIGDRLRGEVVVRNARLLLWPWSRADAVRFRIELLSVPDAVVRDVQRVLPSIDARKWNADPTFSFDLPLASDEAARAREMQPRSAWLKDFRVRVGGWTLASKEDTNTTLGLA